MTHIAEATHSTDDIASKLNQLFGLLDQSCQKLEDIGSHINSGNEALHQAIQGIESHVAALEHVVQGGQQYLETDVSAAIAKWEEFQKAIAQSEDKLEHTIHRVEQAHTAFDNELSHGHTNLETSFHDLKGAFDHMGQELHTLEQTLTEADQTVHQTFNEFSQAIASLHQQVETLQTETDHDFGGLIQDVEGNFTQTIDTAFTHFTEAVTHEHLNNIMDGFESFISHASDYYNQFKHDFEQQGDHLKDQCSQILHHVGQEFEHSFTHKIEEGFEKLVVEVLEHVVEELVTTI
jgi:ABC-type transporter Mla subunit MlaD